MRFVDINDYINDFISLWNKEYGKNYKMYEDLVNQSTIFSDHIVNEGTKALLNDNKFIGLIVTKVYQGEVTINNYLDTGFISLIYVSPEERKKGYGTELFKLAIKELKKLGKKKIFLGMDLNNFFPGLPNICEMNDTKIFFENHGFKNIGRAFNLIMRENPHFTFDNNYIQRVATINDKEPLLQFIQKEFSDRWYYEAVDYFNKGGNGREFALLLDNDKIIGFARINDQESKQIMHNINWSKRYFNLGGIGPLGVDREYRGKKLGARITNFGTQVLFDRGCSDVLVDWTGITKFYEKSGYVICDEFISYVLDI